MKFLEFFIDRPVSATVVNVMLMLCGVLAFRGLVVDEYPKIIVPRLSVDTTYRNASAETVEKEITSLIEERLASVEGLEKISSNSRASHSSIELEFAPHIPMDRAVMQVTEQLARITGKLPKDADQPRVNRSGSGGTPVFYVSVRSKVLSGPALMHFAQSQVKPYFQGIDGIAEVKVWGEPYSIAVDLDPIAMHSQRISPEQIVVALKKNELLLQAGQTSDYEPISLDVVAKNAQDYREMIVGENAGALVRLGDVAQVILKEDDRQEKIRIDGKNSIIVALTKASDGNVLKVTDAARAMVEKINQEIQGLAEVFVESDKSIFVRESLKTIYRTIIEACVLVLLIILLFLRHLRATLIPLVTIPISLLATFMAIKIFGLSVNTITLLALVLAVGLVVDDAIVVLENIYRYIEEGMDSKSAAKKGAKEIGFAIVAMTCTLISVFLPLVFVGDITGTLLREFAITLAAAVFFSGVVALTLSPLMCAHFLHRHEKESKLGLKIENAISWLEQSYLALFEKIFAHKIWLYSALVVVLVLGVFLFKSLSADLLPKEDRGMIGAWIPQIPGKEITDMEPYLWPIEEAFINKKEVDKVLTIMFPGGIQVVALLKPWQKRALHSEAIVAELRAELSELPLTVHCWSDNIGLEALRNSGEGAAIVLALKSSKAYEELEAIASKLSEKFVADDFLIDARSNFNMNQKALSVSLLREPMAALGISEQAISMALQSYGNRMGASEFKLEGQRYRVFLQPAKAVHDLSSIYLSAKSGEQVPLATVAELSQTVQSPNLPHLNQMRSVSVLAGLKDEMSLSEAKAYLEKVIPENVPSDVAISYGGALEMQAKSNKTFILLFFAGLIFIFAVLAIQFEAIIDPLIILFTVPLACLGGILLLWLSGHGTDLYTQVGMLTLIGLITKHGILLTDFVKAKLNEQVPLKEAVFAAAKLRFRPIIMTTAATVLGAVPLITSSGAGMEARASIGLVIVGGMIFGTALTLFVLPSIIYSVHSWRKNKKQTI